MPNVEIGRAGNLAAIVDMMRDVNTRPVETIVPGLHFIGGGVPAHQLAALYRPMIGFVVQGTKRLSIGERSLTVNGGSYFLLPMHVPITATVHSDPDGLPYRSIGLDLDQDILQILFRDVGSDNQHAPSGFAACSMDEELIDALFRLAQLTKRPWDVSGLAATYKREIFYRVMRGPQGGFLRRLAMSGSGLAKVAETVQWIRKNYDQPIDVGDLARNAGMAITTFHRQFKRGTGLSPIQFQKHLRLLEARNLIAYEGQPVTTAAFQVGYESPSQFSREYSRFFGNSPSKHAATIAKI